MGANDKIVERIRVGNWWISFAELMRSNCRSRRTFQFFNRWRGERARGYLLRRLLGNLEANCLKMLVGDEPAQNLENMCLIFRPEPFKSKIGWYADNHRLIMNFKNKSLFKPSNKTRFRKNNLELTKGCLPDLIIIGDELRHQYSSK